MYLQDHVIKGSGDFMEENSSFYVPTLLTDFFIFSNFYKYFSLYVILQDHVVIIWLYG